MIQFANFALSFSFFVFALVWWIEVRLETGHW